jgi:hypothetical protein
MAKGVAKLAKGIGVAVDHTVQVGNRRDAPMLLPAVERVRKL